MATGAPLASKTMSAPHPSVSLINNAAQIFFRNIYRSNWTQGSSEVKLRLLDVSDNDLAASSGNCGERGNDPDGSRAHDYREVTRLNFRFHGCMHAYRQRFNHGALCEADVLRKLERISGRMNYIGRKTSVYWRRCPEAHRRIQVVYSQPAGATIRVRYSRFHADTVTGFEIFYSTSDLGHGTGCFMAEDHWFFHDERANSTVFIVMNVASTDSYRVDGDLNVVGANF